MKLALKVGIPRKRRSCLVVNGVLMLKMLLTNKQEYGSDMITFLRETLLSSEKDVGKFLKGTCSKISKAKTASKALFRKGKLAKFSTTSGLRFLLISTVVTLKSDCLK